MKNLLDVAKLFVESLDYQIKIDLSKRDEEGANLKRFTKERVQAIIADEECDDGRPCAMDLFTAHLIEDCDDDADIRDAVNEWNHGDWPKALAYLSKTSRNHIEALKK